MNSETNGYSLEDQIGFLLRRAHQRHRVIFSRVVEQRIAPQQFAVLAKLGSIGPTSQNLLGRLLAMDAATVQGVVERLKAQGLVQRRRDPADARFRIVELTDTGTGLLEELLPLAGEITVETLAPLGADDADTLLDLLRRISSDPQ
ncbi:MAG: MarR family winged helix-turn-helix transcriptional regulator [Actinomycetota bacterium]|nr:MarR family winged helix-turn-helix transcriptional regulator [Actinomycetota bacterium]